MKYFKEKVMKFEEYGTHVYSLDEKHPLQDLTLKYVHKGPILDVGCGDGALLNVLKDKFEVEGFDASEFIIKSAKNKGLNVIVSTINDFNPNKKYKTILMTGVFAHLYNLEIDFKKVISWLDDDGELILGVPNASSPFIKRHIAHFHFPKYFEFKEFIKKNNLKIKKCVGAGRLRYFPYLSTAIFWVLKKKNKDYSF